MSIMKYFTYMILLALCLSKTVKCINTQDSASLVSCPPFRQFTNNDGLSFTVAVENAVEDYSYTVRLLLFNQSWYNNFSFACDQLADKTRYQCAINLPRENFTADDSVFVVKEQWFTRLMLVEEDSSQTQIRDVSQCPGLLLDVITEPVLRWRLGTTVDKPALKLNSISRKPVSCPCARDVQIWFLQSTGDEQEPIIAAVTLTGFVDNDQDTLTWYDMSVTCPDCHLLSVVLTNYFLLILSDTGVLVSNNLGNASPTAGKQTIRLSPGFNPKDFKCDSITSGQLMYTPFCQSRYHDSFIDDLVFASLKCTNDRWLVLVSSSKSSFSVWRELELNGPVRSVTFNPHLSSLVLLFEPLTNGSALNIEVRKLFVNNLTIDSLPMFETYSFVDDAVTMVIFDHFTMFLLAFGDWVWISADGGNSFEHIYKFGIDSDERDSVCEVLPGWHYSNGMVAVLSKTKLIVAKTGVKRLQHQNLKDILGSDYTEPAYFSFDGNGTLHYFKLNLKSSGVIEITAAAVDVESLIQKSNLAFDHSLLLHRVSNNIVMLYEYKNKESLLKTNGFHNGHIGLRICDDGDKTNIDLKILDVTTFVSTKSSLTSRFATVLTTLNYVTDWKSTTTGALTFVSWSSTERSVLFSAANNAISGKDLYKTITIPFVLSCIIESFESSQAKCYTPLKVGLAGGTVIAAGHWYLLDMSASFSSSGDNSVGKPHWKLNEPSCSRFLTSSSPVRQYDVDLSFNIDIDVTLTFTKIGSQDVRSEELHAFVTNPHLFQMRFNHSFEQRSATETVSVNLKSSVMTKGVTVVRFFAATIPMTCPRTSILFTVVAGCPAAHRLNYLYPVNLTADEWLSGDSSDSDGYPLLQKIEDNYRPPSDLGYGIPTSDNIYCANPSRPLPKYLYRVSQETGTLTQCAGVKTRSDCKCTKEMKLTDDDKFSDCKCIVYRTKFPGNLTLLFNLQLDGTFVKYIPCTDKHCLFRVTELNNRTNWKITMMCSSPLLSSIVANDNNLTLLTEQYFISGCSQVKMEGAGLYNFRAHLMPGLSFCPLYSEFMVYVADVPISMTTKFATNFLVALFFGGLLFIVALYQLKGTKDAAALRRKTTGYRDLNTEITNNVGKYPPSSLPSYALDPSYKLKSVPEEVFRVTRALKH